jgi:acyl carrier protein
MQLRKRLFDFLTGLRLESQNALTDDTALFETGVLDSLALFSLATWIEAEVQRDLDLTNFDIQHEWRTPRAILQFIERHKTPPL